MLVNPTKLVENYGQRKELALIAAVF